MQAHHSLTDYTHSAKLYVVEIAQWHLVRTYSGTYTYTAAGTPVFQKYKHSHLKMFSIVRYKLFSVTLGAILRAEHWKYRY